MLQRVRLQAARQDGVGQLQEADLSLVFLSSIFCLRVSILMYFQMEIIRLIS